MKNDAYALSKKISLAYYIICALALVIILLTVFFAWWYADKVNSGGIILMEVTDGDEVELQQINLVNFVPGQEYRQEIIINNSSSVPISCNMSLIETEDSSLTPFMEVSIVRDDNSVLYHSDMLDVFHQSVDVGDMGGNSTDKYYIVYSMKETADSNAMNKSIVFELQIACTFA